MQKAIQKKGKITPWQTFFFLSPFLFGLYYEFAAYFAGAVLCGFLIWNLHMGRRCAGLPRPAVIGLGVLFACYGLTVFWAVDRGMAFAGFFKVSVAGLFLLAYAQQPQEEREKSLQLLPACGVAMTALSACAWVFEQLRDSFFAADRLGGFFQYSNSFALFLLVGLIVLLRRTALHKREAALAAVLLAGILLTGSRTVFVLLLITAIWVACARQKLRKWILPAVPLVLIGCVGIAAITGSYQTFGRFLTISLESSTLNGRLLYAYDGIRLLFQHPMGLGYMGYFYCQSQVQSGVYTVRFIHNDFLQIALDAGVLALAGFLLAVVYTACSKRTGAMRRQMLITMCLHLLFDFDLEFLSLFFVLLMTMLPESARASTSPARKWYIVPCGVLCAVYLYFGAAFCAGYTGRYTLAVKLYPGNTEALVSQLVQAQSPQEVAAVAAAVLARNPNISLAYQARAVAAVYDGAYLEALEEMKLAADYAPYETAVYTRWVKVALEGALRYREQGSHVNATACLRSGRLATARLASMQTRTSLFAYRIQDKPQFQIDADVLSALEQAEREMQ